jgi:predicted ribosome quality control (RQC) complex YloA/Tae2 family protein
MDQFLLHAVAAEASRRLLEHEVLRVSSLGRSRYVLRFATASRDNLLLSARPDLPRFHLLAARRVQEAPLDRFAAYLDQDLTGAVLAALDKRPWDRVIEMRFRLPRREDGAVERRLVLELFGRSANLFLLDPQGVILTSCHDLKREDRAPAAGARYQPPPGREAFVSIPVGPEAAPVIREKFGGAREFLGAVSPLIARDLDAAPAGVATAEARLEVLLETARSGAWSPVVYSVRPLEEMSEGELPGRDDLLISPLPLLAPPPHRDAGSGAERPLLATPFGSPSEAAEAGLGIVERLRDFKNLKDHHEALVRREIDRLSALGGKLSEELAKARGSETYRRLGEALLAGLTAARIQGDSAFVPDPYDPAGGPITVPIDPARPLQESARLLFQRYKKGKRGVVTIEKRLQAVRARLLEWQALAGPAAAMRTPADLDRLRESMSSLGLMHAPRPRKSELPRATREGPARVRRYTSPDGLTILVGKSGEENDTLTFRVASPWDFWLHAAGRPGAHVVVRNPQRLKTLPDRSLRAAAEIAAYYSGARLEAKVDVHYTQRKHVQKRKGMPGGQVLLRRFRSVQAAPRLPASSLEDV